jgi:LmbE family N-acetylglucosaminyl deacetylase
MAVAGVLAVLAHPDDEAFRAGGTLALLAKKGIPVHLLTATRGEAGARGDPPLCTAADLPAVREKELRCACGALGIEPPRLLDYSDGRLSRVPDQQAVTQVLAAIQELKPEVLLTWPPDGLSGHPDHIAVSRWTGLAYQEAVRLGADAPIALYYLAVPLSVARALGLGQLHAVPDEQIDLTVDVCEVWKQKLAAIRCHRTQTGSSPILAASIERQRLFLSQEHFRRAQWRTPGDILAQATEPAEQDMG